MAALTVLVALEKIGPWGEAIGYVTGVGLISAGCVVFAG
jgi:hypothetical protein